MPDTDTSEVESLSWNELKTMMRPRHKSAHKGDFGHALLVGGDSGYSGAVRLSAEAALRTGSGLVSVGTRPEHAVLMTMSCPELMCHGVETRMGVNKLAKRATVIAVGPGLGLSAWSNELFEAALETALPLVVDADGLNLLAKAPRKNDNWVLTPHPGEAAKLLNCATVDVQKGRLSAVQQLQKTYGGVVVLKGEGSLIAGDGQRIYRCNEGNPGMATGGMGDVLTGIIVGLIAQGHSLVNAAKLGVMIHATAGDYAAKEGKRGLTASDLIKQVRGLVNEY